MRPRRIILAGGGTGGHLFPGVAVLEELRRRMDVDALFVGTERGIEARVIPQRGEKLQCLDVTALKGKTPLGLLRSMSRLPQAALQSKKLIEEHQAELVIGVGGYASGPVALAASLMGVPTAVLEQNAKLGFTNRALSRVVGRGYVSFDTTAAEFGSRGRVFGNPIRRTLVEAAQLRRADTAGARSRGKRIVVLGGSQGARALNEAMPRIFAAVKEELAASGLTILHQCGTAMKDEVDSAYRAQGLAAEVVPFLTDMEAVYNSARFLVARAGASTLAELLALGLPSLLIPFPHAADDHQTVNARTLERGGAALVTIESALHGNDVQDNLRRLMTDDDLLGRMSEAAFCLGKPEAASAIVDDLCEWLGWNAPDRSRVGGVGPIADSSGASDIRSTQGRSFIAGRSFIETLAEPLPRARLRGEGQYNASSRAREARMRKRVVFDGENRWQTER